jgi:protease-4
MYPSPRGGFGKTLLIVLLLVALVVSLVLNFSQIGDVLGSTASVKETTIVSGDPQTKVAVIPIEDDIITDQSAANFDLLLSDVEKDATVKAVVVEINTPGGSASASDEMYHRLLRFKQTTKDAGRTVPVVISMRGLATSGGYYVSCAGDYVFAEPITLTGNIGVILPSFNLSKLVEEHGIEETTLTATTTGHSYKNAGSMFQPSNPLDRAYMQGIVDGLFAQFKAAVETGRATKLHDSAGDIFSGKAFLAQEAKDRGLIDEIGYPEKAYDYAAQAAGVSNKTVVRLTPRTSILDMLGIDSRSTLPTGRAMGISTINGLSVDAQSLRDLICCPPMMIWRAN